MAIHIALIVDATGRYAYVWGEASSWDDFIDQLEELGAEVIEEQTSDWEGYTKEEIDEDCISIGKLLIDTDFVPNE